MALKNLIIKSSFSKLKDGSLKSNYGDLLRCTILIEALSDAFLWLTDSRSLPLLTYFIKKEKILTYDDDLSKLGITNDTRIINLDNYLPYPQTFLQLKGQWYGYIRNSSNEIVAANDFIRCTEPYSEFECGMSWQEALLRGLGLDWREQDYPSACLKNKKIVYDIGMNWCVHQDWTSKMWAEEKWKRLETLLPKEYSVSWQKGLNDLNEYIYWISSCRMIVTCDSLGLHLASALGKKVVAITGVTKCNEYPYDRIAFVNPEHRDCMPCNEPVCRKGRTCLDSISEGRVKNIITKIYDELNSDNCRTDENLRHKANIDKEEIENGEFIY